MIENLRHECVEAGLRRVVLDCAKQRMTEIALKYRVILTERKTCGAYGVDDHQTGWDEYRYEVAEGPTPMLSDAWDLDLDQHLRSLVEDLGDADATLCSVAMSFLRDGDEAGLMESPAISPDQLLWGAREQLYRLADEENFRS